MTSPRRAIDLRDPNAPGEDLSVRATVVGLFPGRTSPLRLRIVNPNSFAIEVTRLTVLVREDPHRPGCAPRSYIRASDFHGPLRVPQGGIRGARLMMTMLLGAPDGCQSATFPLHLTARAVRV
jgi:hypothetical protein